MPIRLTDKDAQWSQDAENIYLQLPLKGANRKRLDIYRKIIVNYVK
jgi:hypothetical protein